MLKQDFEILIYSDCPVQHNQNTTNKLIISSLESAKVLYNSLTKKERSVLLFLYSGFKKNKLKEELEITVLTYRTHKKHVFEKMNFHSQNELRKWCKLYLDKIS